MLITLWSELPTLWQQKMNKVWPKVGEHNLKSKCWIFHSKHFSLTATIFKFISVQWECSKVVLSFKHHFQLSHQGNGYSGGGGWWRKHRTTQHNGLCPSFPHIFLESAICLYSSKVTPLFSIFTLICCFCRLSPQSCSFMCLREENERDSRH